MGEKARRAVSRSRGKWQRSDGPRQAWRRLHCCRSGNGKCLFSHFFCHIPRPHSLRYLRVSLQSSSLPFSDESWPSMKMWVIQFSFCLCRDRFLPQASLLHEMWEDLRFAVDWRFSEIFCHPNFQCFCFCWMDKISYVTWAKDKIRTIINENYNRNKHNLMLWPNHKNNKMWLHVWRQKSGKLLNLKCKSLQSAKCAGLVTPSRSNQS